MEKKRINTQADIYTHTHTNTHTHTHTHTHSHAHKYMCTNTCTHHTADHVVMGKDV